MFSMRCVTLHCSLRHFVSKFEYCSALRIRTAPPSSVPWHAATTTASTLCTLQEPPSTPIDSHSAWQQYQLQQQNTCTPREPMSAHHSHRTGSAAYSAGQLHSASPRIFQPHKHLQRAPLAIQPPSQTSTPRGGTISRSNSTPVGSDSVPTPRSMFAGHAQPMALCRANTLPHAQHMHAMRAAQMQQAQFDAWAQQPARAYVVRAHGAWPAAMVGRENVPANPQHGYGHSKMVLEGRQVCSSCPLQLACRLQGIPQVLGVEIAQIRIYNLLQSSWYLLHRLAVRAMRWLSHLGLLRRAVRCSKNAGMCRCR